MVIRHGKLNVKTSRWDFLRNHGAMFWWKSKCYINAYTITSWWISSQERCNASKISWSETLEGIIEWSMAWDGKKSFRISDTRLLISAIFWCGKFSCRYQSSKNWDETWERAFSNRNLILQFKNSLCNFVNVWTKYRKNRKLELLQILHLENFVWKIKQIFLKFQKYLQKS